jgi:nucleoside-diphosphate-sugar epimerase
MNILIIGNLGYVGPCVVEHFAKARPADRLYGFDIGFFQGNVTSSEGLMAESRLAAQHYGDVRNFDTNLLKGMDAVVYLAAISNDPMGKEFEKPTYDINQECAVTIAEAAKKAGIGSFVFASSCSVYGLADQTPRNEQSPINPLTAYAKSKTQTEEALKKIAAQGFTVTCLRFATACGISQRLRLDLVLNDFVASAVVSKRIEILSDGKPWRPLINVKDMALAIDWAVDRVKGEQFLTVNAGSNDWNYQVIDLAKAVQKSLPDTEISVNPNAQPDNRSYKVDFSLFASLAPAYKPKCTLEQTITDLVTGLRSFNFSDKNFRDSGLIRLKVLKELIGAGKIDSQLKLK